MYCTMFCQVVAWCPTEGPHQGGTGSYNTCLYSLTSPTQTLALSFDTTRVTLAKLTLMKLMGGQRKIMTLEECLSCHQLLWQRISCLLLSGETAAGPKGTRQGLAGCTTSCTSQLQPFLLDALQHHQLPQPLPPSTLLQLCQMAAAALNSCWTHTSCRDSCPGRYSCRPRNPGCSVPAMPALAARQKYGSHCCLPANERRDLPGDQPMRG